MKLVYGALAATLVSCMTGVLVNIFFRFPPFVGIIGISNIKNVNGLSILHLPEYFPLVYVGCIAMICWIHADKDKENIPKRMAQLCAFGVLQGTAIGPLINMAVHIDPFIVITALLCTMTIFCSFSLAAVISPRRSYLYLGGFLGSALMMLCIMSFVGYFVPALRMVWLHLYGGLVLFSLYVIYDSQLIIERAAGGCKDFAGHALTLFMDFIQVFIRIILILLRNRKNNNSSGGILPTTRGEL
jgi:FtsH-binding integral membrane protein